MRGKVTNKLHYCGQTIFVTERGAESVYYIV